MPGELAAAPPLTTQALPVGKSAGYVLGLPRVANGQCLMTKSETLSLHISKKTHLTEQKKSHAWTLDHTFCGY